jgi:hypothetical protein
MWGYSARLSLSKGTLDPLYARVLVIESDEKRLALVTLDLGRTFGPDSLTHLRESVRKSSGISYVLVAASHTHSGAAILDEYAPNATPTWESLALEKIAKAIEEAHQSVVEAQVGCGYGVTYIGHNRRRVNPDGSVTMFWRNPTKLPTSPLDPTVSVFRVDTASRKPLAILVNHACHPAVFGPDNVQYSADFPGAMTRKVEQILGNQALCFFLQGAAGDIDPFYDGTRSNRTASRCATGPASTWVKRRLAWHKPSELNTKAHQTLSLPKIRSSCNCGGSLKNSGGHFFPTERHFTTPLRLASGKVGNCRSQRS